MTGHRHLRARAADQVSGGSPGSSSRSSWTSVTGIVQEAAAILRDELHAVAALQGAATSPPGVAGSLPREPQRLVEALAGFLERRPDLLAGLGSKEPEESILVLRPSWPVTAGDVGYVYLRVRNEDALVAECGLCVTDLIGSRGHRIPSRYLEVSPNPVMIAASGSADVRVEIRVPRASPPGNYVGLLQGDDEQSLRALVLLAVTS